MSKEDYEKALRIATTQTRGRVNNGDHSPFDPNYDKAFHGKVWGISEGEYADIKKEMDSMIKEMEEEVV
jgi:hypothetical protein